MFLILWSQKCGEVMIEPPGYAGRCGVFEIDDCVFVAREFALVEEGPGAMNQAVVLIASLAVDAFTMKAREEGCGASSIETFVVIKDANPQIRPTPWDRIR